MTNAELIAAAGAELESVTPRYLIRKYSAWYRPNSAGYTGSAIMAGRYTLDDAEKITYPNGLDGPRDGMTFIHEDDLQDEDWKAYAKVIAALEAAEAKLAAAEAHADRLAEAAGFLNWFRHQGGGGGASEAWGVLGIALAAHEARKGSNPPTDYERKVAQMKEDFPNGI